jgi:hypothetical protein
MSSEKRWAVVNATFTPNQWEELYEYLSDNGCGWWYAVASGDFAIRPDLGPDFVSGTLMNRDHAEYGNTPEDLIRLLKKRGISAEMVNI